MARRFKQGTLFRAVHINEEGFPESGREWQEWKPFRDSMKGYFLPMDTAADERALAKMGFERFRSFLRCNGIDVQVMEQVEPSKPPSKAEQVYPMTPLASVSMWMRVEGRVHIPTQWMIAPCPCAYGLFSLLQVDSDLTGFEVFRANQVISCVNFIHAVNQYGKPPAWAKLLNSAFDWIDEDIPIWAIKEIGHEK